MNSTNIFIGEKSRFWFSFLAALLLYFFSTEKSFSVTYYSRASTNWNIPSTWSTVGYGGAAASSYPQAGDIANIGDGYTVYITTSSACSGINIGQGASGILEYLGGGTYTLTVSGNIVISTGATFRYNTNNTRTHNLFISGSITNSGSVDFVYDSNDMVNITFNGVANSVVSGSGSWVLNNVTLTKSTSTSYMLDVQSNAFENAIVTLSATYGTYIHNNNGTYLVNNSGSSAFQIDPNVIIKVPQGTLHLSPTNDNCYLQGSLIVNGGTVNIGSTAGISGLGYDQNGTFIPYLEISSGTLNIYGGLTYRSGSGAEPFSFKMTGGNLYLASGTLPVFWETFHVTDVAGSSFVMSGGTIYMQRATIWWWLTACDFGICGTNGTVNVTGGTVNFGTENTTSSQAFNFIPYSNVTLPHFQITGPDNVSVTLKTSYGSTSDFKLLSLYIDSGKTFDIRSIAGTSGDSKIMTLVSTYDGTHCFYSAGTFTARTGTITFDTSLPQTMAGTSTPTFYNLTVNNFSGITLNLPVNINGTLNLANGNLNTSTQNILSVFTGGTITGGSSSSFINGPLRRYVATAAPVNVVFPIGNTSAYRPATLTVDHTNATMVYYEGEVSSLPAESLGYALPLTLDRVSRVRHWIFSRQNVSNFTSATVQLFYGDDDDVPDPAYLRVAHDDGANNWQNMGGSGSAAGSGNITSASFTNFNSRFSLANALGGTNPLPVGLIFFEGQQKGNNTELVWQTISEWDADSFLIAKSLLGLPEKIIGAVKAKGNSSSVSEYSFTDCFPGSNFILYRLLLKNLDGSVVEKGKTAVKFFAPKRVTVFPNPVLNNRFSFQSNEEENNPDEIKLYDLSGQKIEYTIEKESQGNTLTIILSDTAPPEMILKLNTVYGTEFFKIISAADHMRNR